MPKELRDTHLDPTTEAVRDYLENIIALLPGHIFWKDLNCRFLGCNTAQAKVAGLESRHAIIGKSAYDIISKNQLETDRRAQADAIDRVDKEIMHTGIPMTIEEPLMLEDGSQRFFLSQKIPLRDRNNKITGLLGISIDITDRKKMEEDLLIAKEKAEIANHAKDDFISDMEHDLRTPFSGIGGVANILYGMQGDFPKEQLLELLEMMVKSCTQWEDIHNRIFDAVVIDQPQELRKETFSISQELTGIRELMLATLHLKKLSCIINPIPSAIDTITTDKLKFRLIMSSIIGNAINFTEEGLITITVTVENGYCIIRVTDTGIGIPADKLDFIFERFTKLSRSNKFGSNFQGIGAGLYISRHFANLLGGSIEVESIVGKGSAFIVKLPHSM